MSTNEAALPQSTVRVARADPDGILLVIHAGAGNRGKKDTPERRARVEQDLNRALEAGYALLEQGAWPKMPSARPFVSWRMLPNSMLAVVPR